MRAELLVLVAWLAMVGAAAGIYTWLQITAGECMVLSAVLLSGVMYIGAALGQASLAAWGYMALGLAGAVLFILCSRRKKAFFSPALAAVCAIFAGSLIAYRGAFIQNIDDFHQWAAAVKYMLEYGRLPGSDFIGTASMPMFTGTFHLYFQVIGGYNEGVMYASSMLLNAVPLMLALTFLSWKDWKKSILYVAVVYLGMYHLYNHPYKSLYVDLTSAAWAACMALWWANRLGQQSGHKEVGQSAKRNMFVFFIPVIWFAIETKWGIGLLLAGFALIYIGMSSAVWLGAKDCRQFCINHRRALTVAAALFVITLVAGILLLQRRLVPVSLSGVREALTFSTDKARLTWNTLLDRIFTKKLNSKSRLQLTAVPAVFGIAFGSLYLASMQKGRHRALMIAQSIYTVCAFVLYVIALYITYVSTFSYDESVSNAAVHRYLSCIVLFLFFLLMGSAVNVKQQAKERTLSIACVFVLAFEVMGLKSSFISEASAYHFWEVSGYSSIQTAKKRLSALEDVIEDTDRVYLLNQKPTLSDMDEYPMCTLLYYRSDIISNYLKEPWKFIEDGSLKMVHSAEETIEDLPQLLADGGYTYLWIYTTDEYLETMLPETMNVDTEIEDGQLFRVVADEEGLATGLILVNSL